VKKILVSISVLLVAFLLVGQAYASMVTVNFEGVDNLAGTVFGFQADYALTGTTADLAAADLEAYYTGRFNGSSVVADGGAIPGTDMSILNMGISTDWDVSLGDHSVVGYTIGVDPLVTGTLFSLDVPDGVTLGFVNWVLSDATGDPDTFILGQTFAVLQVGDAYTITSPGAQVPIPGAIWLLGSGFLGLVTIRRRRAKV